MRIWNCMPTQVLKLAKANESRFFNYIYKDFVDKNEFILDPTYPNQPR